MINLTLFTKFGGPLTKQISLEPDGSLKSDGSACRMATGEAKRVALRNVRDFGALIEGLEANQAIALGALRPDLPDPVKVGTKRELNGQPGVIARTTSELVYHKGQPALSLCDFDTKGMPDNVDKRLLLHGGYWAALVAIIPALKTAAHVIRRSTSAGLSRADTGDKLPGSRGIHVYIAIKDGADAERFLRTLHDRCWLAGLGWYIVGAGGQLLERSIVDRMVYGPERLVFEGGPVLAPPLEQDHKERRPHVTNGKLLDTVNACPSLTDVEEAQLKELKAKAAYPLRKECTKRRAAFVEEQVDAAKAAGRDPEIARATAVRQCEGVLHPDVVLPFDDEDLAGATVADVLSDPEKFEGATLADPLEGVAYGTCCARIMRRPDGTPWIHSFAHGRTVYELKLDFAAAKAKLERTEGVAAVKLFIELALSADLDLAEIETLRKLTAEISDVGLREIARMLKEAQAKQSAQNAAERRARLMAQRTDPRPQLPVPFADEAWLPVVEKINEILGASTELEPPMRDIDGYCTRVRKLSLPKLHLFSKPTEAGELPAPEQWLLRRMNDIEVSELIEKYIDYVDDDGRSVHLPMHFVRHYVQRDDDVLPTVVTIVTAPIVLTDGTLLARNGLDRERGIMFKIQKELRDCLPRPEGCDDKAVRQAMRFLTADWLCDVATNYVGKCTLIAAGLTLIERALLPDRPAFWLSAGRRGGGKTTTWQMLIKALTGDYPAAAAWSPNEEERRKALLSYFLSGVSYVLWDNISRGSYISCPHIEKSCTSAYYVDRKLGVSEAIATSASAIHLFTGNNVGPCGDLASRSLQVRLEVDRLDPENREFKHPDPIGWTERNRAQILESFYTILLGNPMLKQPQDAETATRFKVWYRLVGSAVEHAAALSGEDFNFKELFLVQEEDEEESASLADVLEVLSRRWTQFKAADIAEFINNENHGIDIHDPDYGSLVKEWRRDRATLRDFFVGPVVPKTGVTPTAVGNRLKAYVDNPVPHSSGTLVLRTRQGRARETFYYVL